jgi:hypothetical protein
LALLVDMESGLKSFSEAPQLAQKCGTHESDSPEKPSGQFLGSIVKSH